MIFSLIFLKIELTQKLYPQADEGSSNSAEETASDENTVDAEFEEVKDEEK